MLEYALGMAAVARGFSDYLATLLNQNPASPPFEFELVPGGHTFDIVAAAIIMLMSVLLSLGVHESAFFISGRVATQSRTSACDLHIEACRFAFCRPCSFPSSLLTLAALESCLLPGFRCLCRHHCRQNSAATFCVCGKLHPGKLG